MRGVVASLLLVGVGWTTSACGSSVFACASDEQCQAGAVAGLCQPSGYCSFPDEGCPSGQRYGDAAPTEVANACVEVGDDSGTTTGPGPGQESTRGDAPPDPDADGPLESSTTAMPVDETTTTGPEPTTGMASQGMTTGQVETCQTAFEDAFDGPELAPEWGSYASPGVEIVLQNGQLGFAFVPTPEWTEGGVYTDLFGLTGGWVRTHMSELDQPELPLVEGVAVGNGLCHLRLFVVGDVLQASLLVLETGTVVPIDAVPLVVPAWLQIRQSEDATVYFEWSEDETSWQEIAVGSFPECGDTTRLSTSLYVGGQLVNEAIALRTFDHFEVCTQ